MSNRTLVMGAVAYDAKVVTIWDGFKRFFAERGLDFDYVLFSNYERQVEAHFAGALDVAWNSPLAWLQAERFAAARHLAGAASQSRVALAAPPAPPRAVAAAALRSVRSSPGARATP